MDSEVDEIDVRVLEETLSKVGSLSQQITVSLGKLSKSGYKAEKAIRPISGKTRMMTVYGRNLDSSLAVIDDIRGYAKLSSDCSSIIEAGPEEVGISAYTETLEKLTNALHELQSSKLKSFYKVVDRTDQLVRHGNKSMKDYFRKVLADSYLTIKVSDYVSNGRPMPILSPDKVQLLKQLFGFFEKTKQQLNDVFVDCVSRYILSSINPLAQSTRPKPSKVTYEKNSNSISVYASVLRGFLLALSEDLLHIFEGKDSQRQVYFEEVCNTSISEYMSLVSAINDHVTKHMQTDSLIIFEVIDCTGQLISAVQSICTRTPAKLTETMQNVQSVAHSVFVEFIRYIDTRVQNLQSLPSDNGVCDATVDIISRMGKMADYKNSALTAISTMVISSWIPSPKPVWASQLTAPSSTGMMIAPIDLLSTYFSDAIDALFLGLEYKAKAIGKPRSQIGFFLLTNLTLIERYCTKSDIHKILGEDGGERVKRLQKRGLNLFLDGWKGAAAHLMDVTRSGGNSNRPLSSRDREIIKEKFKTFNVEFDGLVQRHKSYNLTDTALRQLLAKEIAFISPLYHRFYDKHQGGDFSKNVDKYIKYNKQQFDKILESLG